MSATVLEFPRRRASAHHRMPAPDPACAQVIRLTDLPARVTERDLDAIAALASSANGEWRCEPERDCNGRLSAIIVSGKTEGDACASFLICRGGRKLLLIEAQRSDQWRMLGAFDDVADLALTLVRSID
jgi:hypothetical protein